MPVPELRGGALKLWNTENFETMIAGPAECIAGETRIFNPITGESPTVAELCERGIAPIVQTLFGPAQAEVPFVKGRAALYRVTTDEGNSFLGTGKHLIRSVHTWEFIEDLKVGQKVLYLRFLHSSGNVDVAFTTVKSIEFEREDTFYDLHVPGAEHYLAEGLWHHNTGKTFASLSYLHNMLWKHPGAQAAMLRKTYKSLVPSCLVTYQKIIAKTPEVKAHGGVEPDWYDYPNGSRLWLGGMNNLEVVLSSERDYIYINQAEEFELPEWETLMTRCTGRGSVVPFTRLFGDCNPGPPDHWIKTRQSLLLLESRHEDNPTLFDEHGNILPQGQRSLGILDNMTGVRYQRLRLGKWVKAEGVVYEEFDPAVHIIDYNTPEFPLSCIPDDWTRVCSNDFGMRNPFVYGWFAMDPEGRMYLYREIYMTERLVSDHTSQVVTLSKGERISTQVADHDAEGIATMKAGGLRPKKAYKAVTEGIEAVQLRLRKQADGKPRFYIFRDCLVERDEALVAAKKPFCTAQEFDVYAYAKDVNGKPIKEEPIKLNDHGCFVAGTMIETSRGEIPIERVCIGDLALTRSGYRKVLESGCTNRNADVSEIVFSDGNRLVGTANHPIYSPGQGFIRMDAMRYNDTILSVKENPHWNMKCSLPKARTWKESAFAVSSIVAIQTRKHPQIETTSAVAWATRRMVSARYIAICGNRTTVKFPTDGKSTTKTETHQTTQSKTSKYCLCRNMRRSMLRRVASVAQSVTEIWTKRKAATCMIERTNGTAVTKDAPGIASTRKTSVPIPLPFPRYAKSVDQNTKSSGCCLLCPVSVPINANQSIVDMPVSTMKSVFAFNAGKSLRSINIQVRKYVPVRVLCVIHHEGVLLPVYNLKVESDSEYYANGILVHNCDMVRYAVAEVDHLEGGHWWRDEKTRRELIERPAPNTAPPAPDNEAIQNSLAALREARGV